jgi:8-oxo-dGTP pyrophosphatase MutT (NUDIX family)
LKYIFKGNLEPRDAVSAIITYNNKLLIQKRDIKKNIFFPGHFGLFGGAIEKSENKKKALQRELFEEIGIKFKTSRFSYLTTITMDFKKIGSKKYDRTVYKIKIDGNEKKILKLGEGIKMIWLNKKKVYFKKNIIPYDLFAIWLYLFNNDK